jgi:exopolyphosphatase/guanosine-5'-triphosphate,3'-diphosphate pyrophosphatase
MERVGYPLKVLHEYEPPIDQLLETARWIATRPVDELSRMSGTSEARLSLLPLASLVVTELIRRTEPDRVAVSAYGLREGLLYRQMPQEMRRLDPLIEACRHMETAAARNPGFGDALYDWLLPLYEDAPPEDLRLVQAACLMHDVNWRAHPDYRAELCFESVTRANISGIDHPGRVFLGMALMNRYKSGGPDGDGNRYAALIPPARLAEAQILGKAMRLGAMLSGASVGVLDHAELRRGDRLTLALRGPAREFMGEAVERRLQALASRLEIPGEVVLE